jgi:hypothetical protein
MQMCNTGKGAGRRKHLPSKEMGAIKWD